MKLNLESLNNKTEWENIEVQIPTYSISTIRENTLRNPKWIHFGGGNIFRVFLAGLADTLIEEGYYNQGVLCVETFDTEIIHHIYESYDHLTLAITLKSDGSVDKKVIGSIVDAIDIQSEMKWQRLKGILTQPDLQMISLTITEKGYSLYDVNGQYLPMIQEDMNSHFDHPRSTMAILCRLLYERYQSNKLPLALVSMDNCSHNGDILKTSILTIAKAWHAKGKVNDDFIQYLTDPTKISFPWTMIDKITPRPADSICSLLESLGLENMRPVLTQKQTYTAPYVNAEEPQYLVIEDCFPNGRPPLEKAGVYLTDRKTVDQVERMKVTTCLNPLHTALAVYGCLLDYHLIADEMNNEYLYELVQQIGPVEGMEVVTDPEIISPTDFVNEVIHQRISNPFMPDTPQRIATDTSLKVGIRFGETIKAYVQKYGSAMRLTAIPLAIAGWCRYLLGVNDQGQSFELSPDPMQEELTELLKDIHWGDITSYQGQLKPILSNERIFGINLYEAGIGSKIEEMFLEEISGPNAIVNTLKKYLKKEDENHV